VRGLWILAYHRVHPQRRGALCVTPCELEAQLLALLRRGARPLGGRDLLRALGPRDGPESGCTVLATPPARWSVPRRFAEPPGFLVTFDDGYTDVAQHAWPVLKRLGVPAVVFLIHDWVGRRDPFPWEAKYNPRPDEEDRPMDWPQVRRLQEEGCEFGSHTLGHPDMVGLDAARCRAEIAESRLRLTDRLRTDVPFFCYPRGQYSPSLAAEVESAGYQAALITPRRAGLAEHRYCMRRVGIYAADNGLRYRVKISPVFDMLREAHLRWKKPKHACCS
jgi:peptidoglycan/xylan/chitin deacetylase (PgdA/CDA1 family)